MKNIKFVDLLKLPENELKNLKLVFNSDWDYNPDGLPEYMKAKLGREPRRFDLLSMYRRGEVELVKNSTRTHDPSNKRFVNGEVVFCFIPYDVEDWLLVNVFKVLDDSKQLVEADDEVTSDYKQYLGRLIITWKDRNTRNVRMKSIENIEKLTVRTILEQPYDKIALKFPGYKNVTVSYSELKNKLQNSTEWQSYLKARKGIYLITDTNNGKLYVGSAYGKDGVFGRWKTYMESGFDKNELENGKYPNKKFQEIVKDKKKGIAYIQKNFHYTLLETFTDEISDEDIINRESWWKERLLTKEFGYNANQAYIF